MPPFSAYLARIDVLTPLTPLQTGGPADFRGSAAPSPSPSLTSTSPAKRPRSDSPDTSEASSSSPPSSASAYFTPHLTTSPTTSPTTSIAHGCMLRSILTSLDRHASSNDSSPATSPPTSRPLSRRSSVSCKSVRFARCTNASVFPALSGDEYDRSPIIPTCESESLALPKRKRDEAEGWIKCVERERAAAAKRKAAGEAPLAGTTPCGPWRSPMVGVPSPVEGLHGLIEGRAGGYFVGEERDEVDRDGEDADDNEHERDDDDAVGDDEVDYRGGGDVDADAENDNDNMVVDEDDFDVEAAQRSPPPPLVQDDLSGDDSDGPLSVGSADVVLTHSIQVTLVESARSPKMPSDGLGFGFLERSVSIVPEEDEELAAVEEERERERLAAVAAASSKSAANKKGARDRYGICALGKYSRAEVFQSYDSLGGF